MRTLGALVRFLILSFRLNGRSRQALVYGYAMPLFFLAAFGALFRGGIPPLLSQIGQILVISVLGGACFGLPTTLVADREAGVWRRYRVLPVSTAWMLSVTLVVRVFIVASAALLQLAVAHWGFGTPWPVNPGLFAAGYLLVVFAFMGLGLVVAALADGVPAVQAIGQCLFLPMIILGGVGVPLTALPAWAQVLSAFMPGRYAVTLLQALYDGRLPDAGLGFPVLALTVIGGVAGLVGLLLFRWDSSVRPSWTQRGGALASLVPWLFVGVLAIRAGESRLPTFAPEYQKIGDVEIRSIPFEDLPPDNDFVSPIGPALPEDAGGPRVREFVARLGTWAPAHTGDTEQEIRALLTLAGLADVCQDAQERDIARAAYVVMRARWTRMELRKVLAWIALHPKDGTVITLAPELGVRRKADPAAIRNRAQIYARKFLARVEGVIRD